MNAPGNLPPPSDRELDTRGLNCPLPILRTKKALVDLVSGQVLLVLATDPGAVRDFEAFARQTGNTLVYSATRPLGEDGSAHADADPTHTTEFVFCLRKR